MLLQGQRQPCQPVEGGTCRARRSGAVPAAVGTPTGTGHPCVPSVLAPLTCTAHLGPDLQLPLLCSLKTTLKKKTQQM